MSIKDKIEKASKKEQERYYVTHAEALELRDPKGAWASQQYFELPYECRKIPNILGCVKGTLVIQKVSG